MCIQWCCKNCANSYTNLTHRWARERCNDFYIARSQNEDLTECPNGPWESRRAAHRHPYRGAQVCEDCKKAGRKDYKLVHSARQKANVALGQRPEYTGAIYLGELEIPDNFHTPHLLEAGEVDAMRLNWERFKSANRHLHIHELERQWASRFAALNVTLDPGTSAQPSKSASTFGQRMREEDHNRVDKAYAEELSRSLRQQSLSNTNPMAYKPDGPSRRAHQPVQNNIGSDTNKRNITPVEEEEEEEEASQDPHFHSLSSMGSSSSQSTRARPWDL